MPWASPSYQNSQTEATMAGAGDTRATNEKGPTLGGTLHLKAARVTLRFAALTHFNGGLGQRGLSGWSRPRVSSSHPHGPGGLSVLRASVADMKVVWSP